MSTRFSSRNLGTLINSIASRPYSVSMNTALGSIAFFHTHENSCSLILSPCSVSTHHRKRYGGQSKCRFADWQCWFPPCHRSSPGCRPMHPWSCYRLPASRCRFKVLCIGELANDAEWVFANVGLYAHQYLLPAGEVIGVWADAWCEAVEGDVKTIKIVSQSYE